MNPRARRWLRWTFIAAFLIVAPLVILSTAGYRYNFERRRLERTGALIVESRPAGASVSLNGRPQASETPSRFNRMTPGTYSVRVEKAGYRAWSKTVGVPSGETVFLNRLALFRDEDPVRIAPLGAHAADLLSPDARYGAAVASASSGSELVIIDTKSGEIRLPYRSSEDAASFRLAWSPNSRRLLLARSGRAPSFFVWNAAEPDRIEDLSSDSVPAWSDVLWSQDADTLYGVSQDTLYEITPGSPTVSSSGPAASAPLIVDQTLYGTAPGNPSKLVRRRLRDRAFETVAELPSDDYRAISGANGRVAYASASHEKLFVIDASGQRPTGFDARGRNGLWSADGLRFLYWNAFEVRLHDMPSGSDVLINRLSGPIVQGAWHHPEWNALYAAGNTLYAIETDDQFGRTNLPLATFQEFQNFAVSPNGDAAFVFGTKDGASGLWKLRLR